MATKDKDKNKKPKIRRKLSPLGRFCRMFVKKFLRRHKVINLNDHELPPRCILLCLHKGMKGPFVYQSFLPRFFVPWGAHEMLGNYKSRWKYLYYVFYRQKQKKSKLVSFIRSTLSALFSKLLYNACGVIGTYHDARLFKTIGLSIAHLEADVPIMLFPENSNDGYFDTLNVCHGGFVLLSRHFKKLHNIDLPVYPSYYRAKTREIIIGKPFYVGELMAEGLERDRICEHARDAINGLREYGVCCGAISN